MGNISHINGNVGIGINTPTSLLHLYGSNPVLNIQNMAVSAGSGGELVFGHDQNSSTIPIASVKGSLVNGLGAGGRAGDLKFYTSNAGSLTEKMILTKDGRLGIGVASPTVALDVNGGMALTGKATSASTVSGDGGTTLVTKDYVDSGIGTVSIITMNAADLSVSADVTNFTATSGSGTDTFSSGNNDTNFAGFKTSVTSSAGMPFPSSSSTGVNPSLKYVNSKGSTTWAVSSGSGSARTIVPSEGTWTVMAYVGKTQGSATPVHAIFIAIRTA